MKTSAPGFGADENVGIPQLECEALVTLFNSTDGWNWFNHENWLTTKPLDTWHGVSLNNGHINALNLMNNHLVGSIPPQLGSLSDLQSLYLGGNRLNGSIPSQLGNLSKLQYLILATNNLSGSIPPDLGKLTGLVKLYLSYNQLTGSIPYELGSLTNLQILYLDHNQLTGSIPPQLGNLTNSQELWLCSNQLSGAVPPQLGSLANLRVFVLYSNQLSGSIPPDLANLLNAYVIDLTNNQLTGNIPSQLGSLTNLQALYLSSNQLDGAIPSELGNMAGLIRLDLSKNRLSGAIPETLVNLSKILDQGNDPRLILDFNRLTVPVPYPSVPPTPLEDFLKLKNPDWYLTQSAQTVIPTSGGSLISQDGNITITFPENTVTAPTTFEIIPQPTPQNPTGSLYETPRHNFQINALDSGGIPLPNYAFSNPVTVLLEYTDADIANLEETRLNLYFWDRATSQWKDAATSCSPISVYTRDLEQNRLSVGICHLSEFSLLSTGTKIYLPLLMK